MLSGPNITLQISQVMLFAVVSSSNSFDQILGQAKTDFVTYLDSKITYIDTQLQNLATVKTAREGSNPMKIPVITNAESDADGHGTSFANDGDENALAIFTPTSTPDATTTPAGGDDSSNPWTTISASFSAEDQQSTSTTSSWGMSVGGGAGWGLWSVGGSYAHDESQRYVGDKRRRCYKSFIKGSLIHVSIVIPSATWQNAPCTSLSMRSS